MDWKTENPKRRYIDSITKEEAARIAHLAAGKPSGFEVLGIEAECNGNNIPHVKINIRYYAAVIGEDVEDVVGIFDNLNTYAGDFLSTYCQREIFKAYEEMGFD